MIGLISKKHLGPSSKEREHWWPKVVAQILAPDGAPQVLAENEMGYCMNWVSWCHSLTSISTSDNIQEREQPHCRRCSPLQRSSHSSQGDVYNVTLVWCRSRSGSHPIPICPQVLTWTLDLARDMPGIVQIFAFSEALFHLNGEEQDRAHCGPSTSRCPGLNSSQAQHGWLQTQYKLVNDQPCRQQLLRWPSSLRLSLPLISH